MIKLKKIVAILGPNAVGKSTTSKAFLQRFTKCALVDADWCRAINPLPFTQSTKKTVTENIYCLFRNYLLCEDIDTIVFSYGLHGERKEIFESIISKLKNVDIEFSLHTVIMKCSVEENIRRALKDGREKERIERGIKNTFSFYNDFDYPSIETTNLNPEEVVEEIAKIIK